MRDHSHLRCGERDERADGEKRNQPIRDSAERDEQRASHDGEHDDSARVNEPAAAVCERRREVRVERELPAHARKSGEARVRGQREHGKNRGHRHVVEDAAAVHGADHL